MRTKTFRTLLLCCALPLFTTGCESLFNIEVEAEEICKAEDDLSFPAAFPGSASVEQSIQVPLGDFASALPDDTDVETQLRLKLFDATATTDISGIERASLSVRKPGSPEYVLLGEFRRTGNGGATNKLQLTGSGAVDVLDLAKQEELEFLFQATGSLPTQPWSADIRVCVGAKASANYFGLVF
ncbi:hypothetical protein D7Y13_22310 [Corallococcus praedator]|uniref:Lipoprotein n=1 Tax=Corallococcus praedator TaxID=2316724 RepID=A0ABX9QF70_9BACT|nr:MULTISPECIES: hypothetical protein [Corallococcus]RKH03532.1 hypothetical protein D7X74_36135 [Corallococcus sp. CA047B]RKH26010.1 hypothetical protein D7X75_29085 [Corallococcus sp. CA031C]RKI03325.1 hypothetical protein D7Y13_22310 [Corallococcus praedator]